MKTRAGNDLTREVAMSSDKPNRRARRRKSSNRPPKDKPNPMDTGDVVTLALSGGKLTSKKAADLETAV